MNSGTKYDSGKPPLDLLDPVAMSTLSLVLGFGADKYGRNNWREGFAWSRLYAATLRHILSHMGGEDSDPESGLSHLAHAMACLMFLLNFESTGGGQDDRYSSQV